jgi:ATPase subunit of ABC transporter with duplicated ATPase domains
VGQTDGCGRNGCGKQVVFGAILCDALDDQQRVFAHTMRVRLLANQKGRQEEHTDTP